MEANLPLQTIKLRGYPEGCLTKFEGQLSDGTGNDSWYGNIKQHLERVWAIRSQAPMYKELTRGVQFID